MQTRGHVLSIVRTCDGYIMIHKVQPAIHSSPLVYVCICWCNKPALYDVRLKLTSAACPVLYACEFTCPTCIDVLVRGPGMPSLFVLCVLRSGVWGHPSWSPWFWTALRSATATSEGQRPLPCSLAPTTQDSTYDVIASAVGQQISSNDAANRYWFSTLNCIY